MRFLSRLYFVLLPAAVAVGCIGPFDKKGEESRQLAQVATPFELLYNCHEAILSIPHKSGFEVTGTNGDPELPFRSLGYPLKSSGLQNFRRVFVFPGEVNPTVQANEGRFYVFEGDMAYTFALPMNGTRPLWSKSIIGKNWKGYLVPEGTDHAFYLKGGEPGTRLKWINGQVHDLAKIRSVSVMAKEDLDVKAARKAYKAFLLKLIKNKNEFLPPGELSRNESSAPQVVYALKSCMHSTDSNEFQNAICLRIQEYGGTCTE